MPVTVVIAINSILDQHIDLQPVLVVIIITKVVPPVSFFSLSYFFKIFNLYNHFFLFLFLYILGTTNRQTHRESKKEKFPNYLHHIPPEDDDKATRTLFVGNLEVTISEPDLRRIFERYGVVEDIDVKRPPPGQGNAYAFIKFLNLDMAHRAKVEMSGQYIGKFQCKIGYGKATPTPRIWVGGLGSWTSLSQLEREFDRFGSIRKIDFVKGNTHAYLQFDSIDAATAACQEMRGHALGGPDKRLRVDFADPSPYSRDPSSDYSSPTRPVTTTTTSGKYLKLFSYQIFQINIKLFFFCLFFSQY